MPSKLEILTSLNKSSYSKEEVSYLVNSVKHLNTVEIVGVKKGDVYTDKVGSKMRPCVVFRVYNNIAYSFPLSTTEDELNLCAVSSRFLPDTKFISRGICVAKVEHVKTGFICTLDNNKQLNEAIILNRRLLIEDVLK